MKRASAVVILLLITASVAFCQPGDPNGGAKPGEAPIGGIGWLLISGAAFGAQRMYVFARRRK